MDQGAELTEVYLKGCTISHLIKSYNIKKQTMGNNLYLRKCRVIDFVHGTSLH